jgi:hypothetical protein
LTESDSNYKFSEKELKEIIKSLAIKIEELKNLYPHFENYKPDEAIYRSNLLWYKHNIQLESNPNYTKELEARKKIRPIKKPLPPQEIPIYPEKDGIELYIKFTEYEIYRNSQRIWLPNYWIGNYAVEVKVKGAVTDDLKNIKEKINKYILSIKHDFEK